MTTKKGITQLHSNIQEVYDSPSGTYRIPAFIIEDQRRNDPTDERPREQLSVPDPTNECEVIPLSPDNVPMSNRRRRSTDDTAGTVVVTFDL